MATGDIASRGNSSLDTINQLLLMLKGSPATTSTSSEVVSPDKATAYLQNLLQGPNGLAAVSAGQKASGMYNSSVNQQLTNDLLARTSAQTAALSTATTKSTSTGAAVNPVAALASLAGGQVAGSLLGPTLATAKKKLGFDQYGQNISDSIFGNGSTGGGTIASSLDQSSLVYPAAIDTVPINSAALQNLGDVSASSSGGAASGGLGAGGFAALGAGAAGIGALASGGGAAAGTAALTDASYAILADGTIGTFGGAAAAAGAAEVGTAAVAADAAATAAGSAGITDALVAAAAAWIICTELNKQGRLPTRWYRHGAKEFLSYDTQGKQGYYIWAIPSVRHLRKHPHSLYSKAMEVIFNARAEYLAAKAGCTGARKTTLGFLTTHILYTFCWTLSRTIARKLVSTSQILGA